MSKKSDAKIAQEFARTEHESLAQAELGFFETELAAIKTLSDVAETRYAMGFTEDAHRAKQQALDGIRTVRQFLEKAHLIAPEKISAIADRCDALQLLVNGVGATK